MFREIHELVKINTLESKVSVDTYLVNYFNAKFYSAVLFTQKRISQPPK